MHVIEPKRFFDKAQESPAVHAQHGSDMGKMNGHCVEADLGIICSNSKVIEAELTLADLKDFLGRISDSGLLVRSSGIDLNPFGEFIRVCVYLG